jgi:hypothetical protein
MLAAHKEPSRALQGNGPVNPLWTPCGGPVGTLLSPVFSRGHLRAFPKQFHKKIQSFGLDAFGLKML